MVPSLLTCKPIHQGWWALRLRSSLEDLLAKTRRWLPWIINLVIFIAIRPLRQRKALILWPLIFQTWVCKVDWLEDKRCQRGYTTARTNHKMCCLLPTITSLEQMRIYNWLGSSTWRNHWMVDKLAPHSLQPNSPPRSSTRRSICTPMACMGRILKPERKIKEIKKPIRTGHSLHKCSNNMTQTPEGHRNRTGDWQAQELVAVRNNRYTLTRVAIQTCRQMVKELARMKERRCLRRTK